MLPAVGGGQVFSWQAIPLPGGRLLTALIICLAAFNLIRMVLYLAGAQSLHDQTSGVRQDGLSYRPTVSLVVPAHNEAAVIEATLDVPAEAGLRPAADHPGRRWLYRRHLERIYAYKRTHDTNDVLAGVHPAQRRQGRCAQQCDQGDGHRRVGDVPGRRFDHRPGRGDEVCCLLRRSACRGHRVQRQHPAQRHASRAGATLRVPDQLPHEEGPEQVQRRVHHRRDREHVPAQRPGRGGSLRHQHDDRGHRPDAEDHLAQGQSQAADRLRARCDHLHRGGAVVPVPGQAAVPLEVRSAAGLLQELPAVLLPGHQAFRRPVVVLPALCAVAGRSCT